MNEQTLVILERIGAERSTFPNCSILKINEVNKIEGLGEVMPIPVSHSSVDALAFLITTDQGDTIFYSGDIRNGDRTSKALERVKKNNRK